MLTKLKDVIFQCLLKAWRWRHMWIKWSLLD